MKEEVNELKRKGATVLVCVLGGRENVPSGISDKDVIIPQNDDTPIEIMKKVGEEIDKGKIKSNP